MKFLFKALCVLIFTIVLSYLLLPSPNFPSPLPDSLQSIEPADTESIYRKAYYTNYSRSQILAYYAENFSRSPFANIKIFQYLLNYPPEESFTKIRDQTQSSWLQELVHPGRESLFINGFYPTKPTEQININGVHYLNKITLHLIPSKIYSRLTVFGLILIAIYWLKKEYEKI